mgnify:CR=1 FL=1
MPLVKRVDEHRLKKIKEEVCTKQHINLLSRGIDYSEIDEKTVRVNMNSMTGDRFMFVELKERV